MDTDHVLLRRPVGRPVRLLFVLVGLTLFLGTASAATPRVETVAGRRPAAWPNDGLPAVEADLHEPTSLAVGAEGAVYVGESPLPHALVQRVGADGRIHTVMGLPALGDRGRATDADVRKTTGIAVTTDGAIFFSDTETNRVWRVTVDNVIERIAGAGDASTNAARYSSLASPSDTGDDGPADQALLSGPTDIALDSSGRLFIADTQNNRVRVVTPDGVIHRFAGGSGAGYSGDGGLAVDAALVKPEGLAIGPDGSVFIADRGNRVIRRVDTDGVISTVAGNGQVRPYNNPEPTQLSALQLNSPSYVAVAADGALYVSERSSLGRVWRIDTDGSVTPVIHANMQALALDGTPIELEAIEATGLALLADGSLVVGDERDPYVLRLAPDGGLSVLAGNAGQRSVGDSMPAAQTGINGPQGIAIGSDGTLYVALACCQGSVVSIDPNGIQHILVARRGHRDGSTVDTKLSSVDALAVTGDGAMYVGGFHEFWHSTPRGYATYIARNRRIPPESGPADQLSPRVLAVTPNGSVYAADAYQLYRLKTDGSLDWVAGTSNYLGSEGPIEGAASDVALAGIGGLAVAADGSLLIAQRAQRCAPTPL